MILGSIFVSYHISAQEGEKPTENIDVMFVLDTSYSMNETDKDKISMEMMKLFTDISYSFHTRIGFVAYNDAVEEWAPLTEITSEQEKEAFKKKFDLIKCTGKTDTGLGLKKGWELLNNASPEHKKCIVLLTDGEIDLNLSDNQRTPADSIKDINDVVGQAAAKGIPIYTVGMRRNTVDISLLEYISKNTNAASYMVDMPQDLLKVFNQIVTMAFNSSVIPITTIVATGDTQEINIKLPNQYATEANLIFLSSSPLKETQVIYDSKNSSFYNSKHYSLLKIRDPQQQDVKIRFKGELHDVISVSTLSYYDLKGELEVDRQPISGKQIGMRAYLVNNHTGMSIADGKIYEDIPTTLIIRNLETDEEITIPAQATENGWETDYIFKTKGKYSISVQSENCFYNGATTSLEVNVSDEKYINQIIIAILVLVMVGIIYCREKKMKPILPFSGQINVYYHRLRYYEEEEMPALTVQLDDVSGVRRISLCEILRAVSPSQGLIEGEKIWFCPGTNRTIVLFHMSACAIMVGQAVISKKQNYVLHYGDKIYITFPDNGAELELHYK